MIEKIRVMFDEGAFEPVRAHTADAGLDLRTPYEVTIRPDCSVVIDTKVHLLIPEGYYGKLESKSGLNVKHGIVSLGGTIDANYIGSIKVKLYNLGHEIYTFLPGDKIVQIIIQPCETQFELIEVDRLEETDRGDSGFGGSGR